MQKVKKVAHTEWFRLKLMFQADRKVAALYVVVVGLYSAIPLLSAWLWKLLVDASDSIFADDVSQQYVDRENKQGVQLYIKSNGYAENGRSRYGFF